MMKKSKSGIIIWAVDPTQNPRDTKKIVKLLRFWSKTLKLEILPVSVFVEPLLNLPFDINLPKGEKIDSIVNRALAAYMKKASTEDFLKPHAIFTPSSSNRRMANELAKFSQKHAAKMIFVNTRSRKTMNPLRLGGFAETLITKASIPTFILNSRSHITTKIRSILFPTDLGRTSKSIIPTLLFWAKKFKSHLLFFNQIEILKTYSPEFTATTYYTYVREAQDEIERDRRKKLLILTKNANNSGVPSEAVLIRQRKNLADEIIDLANKKRIDLITLVSNRSPIAQALLGSVPRDILLQSPCPVVIFPK